jgi:hypothetical protein
MDEGPLVVGRLGFVISRRIRLVAYGASLESWLGASPHGFESHILRSEKAPDFSGAFVISWAYLDRLDECA